MEMLEAQKTVRSDRGRHLLHQEWV